MFIIRASHVRVSRGGAEDYVRYSMASLAAQIPLHHATIFTIILRPAKLCLQFRPTCFRIHLTAGVLSFAEVPPQPDEPHAALVLYVRIPYNFSLRDELCIHRTLCRSSPDSHCLKILPFLK
jgi:hypothetical protein